MSWRRPRAFALRLHASAAPPRVGLTQALGGRKAVCSCVDRNCDSSASAGIALRTVLGHVASSVMSVMRACTSHASRCPALETVTRKSKLSATDAAASETPGGKFTGRAQASPLRFSAIASGLYPRRLPSRLTSRSSRPRVVASATCFTLRLHVSAAPPQGGLTPALAIR